MQAVAVEQPQLVVVNTVVAVEAHVFVEAFLMFAAVAVDFGTIAKIKKIEKSQIKIGI